MATLSNFLGSKLETPKAMRPAAMGPMMRRRRFSATVRARSSRLISSSSAGALGDGSVFMILQLCKFILVQLRAVHHTSTRLSIAAHDHQQSEHVKEKMTFP